MIKNAQSNASLPDPGCAGPSQAAGSLVEMATLRVKQGLAPPRQIYQVHYRHQIDWSQFPSWARPSDPEMFDCHEG